ARHLLSRVMVGEGRPSTSLLATYKAFDHVAALSFHAVAPQDVDARDKPEHDEGGKPDGGDSASTSTTGRSVALAEGRTDVRRLHPRDDQGRRDRGPAAPWRVGAAFAAAPRPSRDPCHVAQGGPLAGAGLHGHRTGPARLWRQQPAAHHAGP